jgi:predicted chitinase
MDTYAKTLSEVQKKNMSILRDRMIKKGITNIFSQAAILSIVSKESEFIAKSESLYYKTPEDLHRVFPSVFPTVDSARPYVKNTELTANKVYGGKYGNKLPGDGFKYRGRGYNQITFYDRYLEIGRKIGVDLVNNPDLLNDPVVAADALIQYFLDEFSSPKGKAVLPMYKSTGINDFKTLPDSVGAFYHANAGWGHTVASIIADPTGGRKKAVERSDGLYAVLMENKGTVAGGSLFFLALAAWGIIKLTSKKNETKK